MKICSTNISSHLIRKCIFLFSFAFLFSVFASSESFRFEHLTSENGLSGNSISSMVQDNRGFIWFGTQDGLNRYDGKDFILYEHLPFRNNSLQHNLVQTMYYDSDKDIIWIGTYGGLSALDPVSGKIRHYSLSDMSKSRKKFSRVIVSIAKDRTGRIWIGTLSGLLSLDPEKGDITEYVNKAGDESSLPDNSVRDIYAGDDGRIWVATYGGLAFFHEGRFFRTSSSSDIEFPSEYIMDIEKIDKNRFLIASWDGGISVFNESEMTVTTLKFPDNRFYFLKKDSRGHFWAGIWGGGIYYFEDFTSLLKADYIHLKADKSNKYSISNNIGYSFLEDDSGLIWIGTNGGGVNKYNPDVKDCRFLYSISGDSISIPDERMKDLLFDDEGLLWIGTYSSGLYRYESKKDKLSRFSHDRNNPFSLSNDSVNELFLDSRDNLWIGTNSGINRHIPGKGFRHYSFDGEEIVDVTGNESAGSPENDIIYAIFEDKQGRFWIGSYLNGVYLWDVKSGSTVHYYPEGEDGFRITDQMVFDINDDKFGNIWIGTNFGLNIYDIETGKIRSFLYDHDRGEGISNNVIIKIFKDSAGDMWLGTSGGGLNRYNYESENFHHFTKENGLQSNNITGISEDRRGNIVVTTNKGLSVIDRRENRIFTLSYQFGMDDQELKGDIEKDGDGNFYISASGVIYKIDTESYFIRNYDPRVVISSFKVFRKEYVFDRGHTVFNPGVIELPWSDNSFSFNFAALDYTSPLNNRYEYILEGFDNEWVSSGNNNYANYTNIPPGRYSFRVKGSNSSGKISSDEPYMDIVISPPFYRSFYAYILYLTALITVFYSIIMIVRGKESVKRLREENRLKNELIDANCELDRLIRIDPLTGVYNRHHFRETIENGWHLHKRLGMPVSLLMADIDFFKAYNDTYGHVAGDKCLKKFADILCDAVSRKTDTVFRYGGEEFILLLLDTDLEGASVVAEKIREKLVSAEIVHSGSAVSKFLTASIGIVSTDNTDYDYADKMIIDVDRKLYIAKEHGRDTVIC